MLETIGSLLEACTTAQKYLLLINIFIILYFELLT